MKISPKYLPAPAIFIIIIFIIISFGQYRDFKANQLKGPDAPETISISEIETNQTKSKVFPEALNLDMVFYTQAPYSDWDYPWQEACEEASILLVANEYLDLNLNREAYNNELLKLVEWEMDVFGAYEHTDVDQTVQMIEENYSLETQIHTDPSFEDIQRIISKGHFIVAPFAGKLLNNPNFQNGGPVYHMLVIKGYDAEKMQVVTNDVGTRNGENYVYSWEVIESALHNWHDDDILRGEAQFIEVFAPSISNEQ